MRALTVFIVLEQISREVSVSVLSLEIVEVIIEPILTCEGWLHLSQWVLHAAATDFRLLAQGLNRKRGSSTDEHVPVNGDAVTPRKLKLILGILNLYRDARPEWFEKIILVAQDFEVQGVFTVAEKLLFLLIKIKLVVLHLVIVQIVLVIFLTVFKIDF